MPHSKYLTILIFQVIIQLLILAYYSMDRQEIELFTKDPSHYGKNNNKILMKFMTYVQTSSDPLNIFRYMEQKAICTFLPTFWLFKAQLLATIGDYSSSFVCLGQVEMSNDLCDEESEKIVNLEIKYKELFQKMQEEIKQHPIKSKRSVEQFNLFLNKNEKEYVPKLKKLIAIYEKSYQTLKKEKQNQELIKRQIFERSWLYCLYENQAFDQTRIIQKSRDHPMEEDILGYHSLFTPPKKRQHKLTKTVDSVQMRKKKKKYEQSKKDQKQDVKKQEEEKQNEQKNQIYSMVNSLPVGRHFSLMKKRVTFGAQDYQQNGQNTEKINRELNHLSFHKNSQKSRNSSLKVPNGKHSHPCE